MSQLIITVQQPHNFLKIFKLSSLERKHLLLCARDLSDDIQLPKWYRYISKRRKMLCFYNKEMGVVLKKPAFILEHRTPLVFRAPTIDLGYGWVCQPILEKKRLKLAYNRLLKDLKPYIKRGIYPDIHIGNIGWYNNKPLFFDW
jgi:hypothetical protein